MPMSVCLNRLVSFLILGLWYVNTVHFLGLFLFLTMSRVGCVFCIFAFSRVMALSGKLFLCAMDLIVFHSVFCHSVVSGRECILVMW
jgi:hypothetical protein